MRVVRCLALAAMLVTLITGCGSRTPPPARPCIPSGTDADINRALQTAGAVAELCRGAVFTLDRPVRFTASDQRLETEGRPKGAERALLRITSPALTTAVYGLDRSGITIDSIRVDGGRTALGPRTGDALILIGGKAQGQTVHNVEAFDTRSWSTIAIFEGAVVNQRYACRNATITENTITWAGTPDGNWADGISLACNDSVVRHNTIRDATDGGIVIFGAAGSMIADNTIIAASRTLLGGINMVDVEPSGGNYEGTTVTRNTIRSEGALIKVGIGMGPGVWFCQPGTNTGAVVTGNTVEGDMVGYSFPVSGVRNWTVSGNSDRADHSGLLAGRGCSGPVSPPGGFLAQAAESSALQPEYADGSLTYLLDVYERGKPPTRCGVMYPEQPLPAGTPVRSCDGRFALVLRQDGTLTLDRGTTTLWTAPLSSPSAATLVVQADGNLVALDASAQVLWATGTAGHPGARLAIQDDGNLVVYDTDDRPLWDTGTVAAA